MTVDKFVQKVILCFFLLAILFTMRVENASARLGDRESLGMKVDSKGFVYVSIGRDGMLLKFDGTGQFVEVMKPFTVDGKPLKAMLFDIDRQDSFWLINCDREGLLLYQLSPDGKLLKKMRPSVGKKRPVYDGVAKPIGMGFTNSEITVDYEAQLAKGVNEKFNVPPDYLWKGDSKKLPEQYRDYAADADGNLYLLFPIDCKGLITKMSLGGETLSEWEAEPSPITSVSSFRGITTDVKGNVYVLDSSWEVSSSLENSGSIQKFSPDGKFLFRIKKGFDFIDYPQEMAVDRDENIYLLDLENYISKFDKDGRYLFRWNILPPKSGESWNEKQRLEKLADSISDQSRTEDLIVALAYGDFAQRIRAADLIAGKGAGAAPLLVQALIRYEKAMQFNSSIKEVFDEWGEEGLNALKKLFVSGSPAVKKKLAVYLAGKGCKEVVPVLREMIGSGDDYDSERAVEAMSEFFIDDELITSELKEIGNVKAYGAGWDLRKRIDITLPKLLVILNNPADPLRDKVAEIIVDAAECPGIKEKRSLESLRNLASSRDPFVRKTAVLTLWKNGDRSLDGAVLRLAEEDPEIREDVFNVFKDRNDSKCVPLLVRLINTEKDPDLRKDLLIDLKFIDNDRAYGIAMEIVDDRREKENVKADILRSLYPIPEKKMPEFLPSLRKVISTGSGDVLRRAAMKLIGKTNDKQTISLLWSVFENPSNSEEVRFTALASVGRTGNADQLDKLWGIFLGSREEDPLHDVSFFAIYDAGGDEKHLPQLLMLLKDRNYALQAAAILGRMGKVEALPVLVEETKRMGLYTRIMDYLLDPLIAIGKPAAEELRKLADYPNACTRLLVAKVLAKAGDRDDVTTIRKMYLKSFENTMESHYIGIYARLLLDAGENPFRPYVEWMRKNNYNRRSINAAQYMFMGEGDLAEHLSELLKKETDEDMAAGYVTILLQSGSDEILKTVSEYRATVTSGKLREKIDSLMKKYGGKEKK
jgi:HEAT repeat protein